MPAWNQSSWRASSLAETQRTGLKLSAGSEPALEQAWRLQLLIIHTVLEKDHLKARLNKRNIYFKENHLEGM